MDRDYGAAFANQGYFARHGTSRHRNNGFNFSINPQAMAANAKRKEAALSSSSEAVGQTKQAEKVGLYRSGF